MRWRQRRRSGVRSTLLYLLPALVFVMAIGGSRTFADDPKGFEFVDTNPATITPERDGSFSSTVVIKNSGGEPQLLPKPALRGGPDCTNERARVEFVEPKVVGRGEFDIFKLKISGIDPPMTCYVELQTPSTGKPDPRSLKQFKLSQHFVSDWAANWLKWTLSASFVTMIAAFVVAWRTTKRFPLCVSLGSPAWDFSKSWTSTLTLGSGIVAAALAVSALPDLTHHASKSGYATLVLLFSAMALFAPLPYFLFMYGDIVKDNGKPVVVTRGSGLFFLITCHMTLIAGLGQIAVLGLLLDEVFKAMCPSFWKISTSLVSLAWFILYVYAVRSIRLTFELQKEQTPTGFAKSASSHPSWSLL